MMPDPYWLMYTLEKQKSEFDIENKVRTIVAEMLITMNDKLSD